MKRELMYVE